MTRLLVALFLCLLAKSSNADVQLRSLPHYRQLGTGSGSGSFTSYFDITWVAQDDATTDDYTKAAEALATSYNDLVDDYTNPYNKRMKDVEILYYSEGRRLSKEEVDTRNLRFANLIVLLQVLGTCNSCASDSQFTLDLSGRFRNLKSSKSSSSSKSGKGKGKGKGSSKGSSDESLPTEEELLSAYADQLASLDIGVTDATSLDEVDEVTMPTASPVHDSSSSTSETFRSYFDITWVTEDCTSTKYVSQVAASLATAYNNLVSYGYTNPESIRMESVEVLYYEGARRLTEEEVNSRGLRFSNLIVLLSVLGSCTSCASDSTFTLDLSGRALGVGAGALPTEEELRLAYVDVVADLGTCVTDVSALDEVDSVDYPTTNTFMSYFDMTWATQDCSGTAHVNEVANGLVTAYNDLVSDGYSNPYDISMTSVEVVYYEEGRRLSEQEITSRNLRFANLIVLLQVLGTCNSCASDSQFTLDLSGRFRKLSSSKSTKSTKSSKSSKSSKGKGKGGSVATLPTEDELMAAYNEVVDELGTCVTDVTALDEVEELEYPTTETSPGHSSTTSTLLSYFDLTWVTEDCSGTQHVTTVANAIKTAYNGIVDDYTNPDSKMMTSVEVAYYEGSRRLTEAEVYGRDLRFANIIVLLQILGTCNSCASDSQFTLDLSGRFRRLKSSKSSSKGKGGKSSKSSSKGKGKGKGSSSDESLPSEEDLRLAYVEVVQGLDTCVTDILKLDEVDEITYPTSTSDSTDEVDTSEYISYFDITWVTEDCSGSQDVTEAAGILASAYNDLVEGYSNPYSQSMKSVEVLYYEGGRRLSTEEVAARNLRFANLIVLLQVLGTCNSCASDSQFTLDLSGRNRVLGVGNGILPTEEELRMAYADALQEEDLCVVDVSALDEVTSVSIPTGSKSKGKGKGTKSSSSKSKGSKRRGRRM
eukprot:Nitzschia sp. Nitz4//scaffold79_size90958//59855//62644//NITZ4_005033-RA/size90958-processed-gene-0.94-mRNA-1//1//CDS//3329558273//4768//frame0